MMESVNSWNSSKSPKSGFSTFRDASCESLFGGGRPRSKRAEPSYRPANSNSDFGFWIEWVRVESKGESREMMERYATRSHRSQSGSVEVTHTPWTGLKERTVRDLCFSRGEKAMEMPSGKCRSRRSRSRDSSKSMQSRRSSIQNPNSLFLLSKRKRVVCMKSALSSLSFSLSLGVCVCFSLETKDTRRLEKTQFFREKKRERETT